MSIILTGLIQFFRPLLSSLSGVLECKGVAPWYFLTGLRIVAIFFSSGPWDSLKQDVTCNWVAPAQDKSKEFCTVLCQNLYFPLAVTSTAALVFMVVLLLVGLMRLTTPRKKKKKEDENENDKITGATSGSTGRGVAVVTAGPGGASSVYMAGPHGLPMRYNQPNPRSHNYGYFHPHVWHDRDSMPMAHMPMAHMPGSHSPTVGLQLYGGYDMPFYPGYHDPSEMPNPNPNLDHCNDMSQHRMTAYPTEMQPRRMMTYGPETGPDQYKMPSFQGSKESINAPTSYAPAPMVYKSKMPPHYRCEEKDHEGHQQRYRGPKEYGDSTDYAYTMGRKAQGGGKMNPRYPGESKYIMATKCKTISESNMYQIAAHPRPDTMNMAIKRRPVHGGKMKTKQQLAFEDPGRSDMGPQPWMAEDSHCRSTDENKPEAGAGAGAPMAPGPTPPCPGGTACACAGNNPCQPGPSSQPQRDPGSTAAPGGNTQSVPGPQDHAKLLIANICGIPLFDIWVALLLTSETCFLCIILLIQMPRLVGGSWICSLQAVSCPDAVECAVKGRAEKRMALWGMAFTSILFIIACCGYFHIRFCWNKRCRRMCSEPQGSCPGACAADTAPEGHVIRGDVENGSEEKEVGL